MFVTSAQCAATMTFVRNVKPRMFISSILSSRLRTPVKHPSLFRLRSTRNLSSSSRTGGEHLKDMTSDSSNKAGDSLALADGAEVALVAGAEEVLEVGDVEVPVDGAVDGVKVLLEEDVDLALVQKSGVHSSTTWLRNLHQWLRSSHLL